VNVPNNLFDVKITYNSDLFPEKTKTWVGKNLTQENIQSLLVPKVFPVKKTLTHHKRKFEEI
jgi:hypothetical protein